MNYNEKIVQGLPVFELEGKMMGDVSCASLRDRVKEVAAEGQKQVVLDCENVQWLNSAGFGFVLSCVTSLRRIGGDVHFIHVHDKVAYYFSITKLDTVLSIHADLSSAAEKLRSDGLLS